MEFILFVLTLMFSCSKNDDFEHSVLSGKLDPGENISVNELDSLTIYLGKLNNNVSFTDFHSDQVNLVDSALTNNLGEFKFSNLSPGDYLLGLNEPYCFDFDTILTVSLDGKTPTHLEKSVIMKIPDNTMPLAPSKISRCNLGEKINKIYTHFENNSNFKIEIYTSDERECYKVVTMESMIGKIEDCYREVENANLFIIATNGLDTLRTESFEWNTNNEYSYSDPFNFTVTTEVKVKKREWYQFWRKDENYTSYIFTN